MITDTALNLLEFHKLLGIISSHAHCEASQDAVRNIRPLKEKAEIGKRLGLIEEIRRISLEGSPLGIHAFQDIRPLLSKIRPEGAVLEPGELAGFLPFLNIASDISSQIGKRDDLPCLAELAFRLTGFPDILRILNLSIDSEGNILDTASHLLSQLRGEVRKLEGRIRKKIEEIMRDESVAVFLQDNFITERSGRWVIPVRMDSKGQVRGVVHDVSRSGETAFIEPLAVISLTNELENLLAEQKAEEIRILRDICSKLRPLTGEIEVQFGILVYLDVLSSISRLADELGMRTPEINESGKLVLSGARHPLLVRAFGNMGEGREVVPLDLELGGADTVMVITGSNAGGKTVAIKTVGLLLLMALSGMPVPADSASSFPLVQKVLVDIGDEQSIENSLSTFSAHVANISDILKKADSKSLVLIDELGTGTDPDEGAALACAVLKEIRERGSLLLATSHLTDIKGFVHRTKGMLNASMEFDEKALTPLYRLRVGEPGRSHALEIAGRYGLPESIIDSARDMLGGIRVEFDNLIADLNARRAEYEAALKEIRKREREMEEKERLLSRRLSEAETRQREILAKAYSEASNIVTDARRQMNALLEEIKKGEKTRRRQILKQVEAGREEIVERLKEFEVPDYGPLSMNDLRDGDVVFVKSLGYDASVIGVDQRHGRLRVRSGAMEIEVPVSDVGRRRGRPAEAKTSEELRTGKEETVSSRINLVGLRVDEALSRLEPFLNRASLSGLSEVTVIHGVGTGALSRAVRVHLTGHPLVEHFRSGEPPEGGAGVTVVTLA